MITAITYGDAQYDLSCKFNLLTAKIIGGANETRKYSFSDIDKDFAKDKAHIFKEKKGGGLWLWKPYIILKALETVSESDYLMYLDAGAYYVNSIKKLVVQLEKDGNDILFSSSILPNGDWCEKSIVEKYIPKECQDLFNESHQAEAGYILIKKNSKTVEFIKSWLELCLVDENLSGKVATEKEFFREHRHDQSLLNIVMFLNNIKAYKGLSGRSEYKCYVRYSDAEFYGYAKYDLLKMAYDEKNSEYFKNSNYKRIVVNTRINTNNKYVFAKSLIKKTIQAIVEDTCFMYFAKKEMKKYEVEMEKWKTK